jgi:hypothetical protein
MTAIRTVSRRPRYEDTMDFRSSEPAYDLRIDNFQTGQHLANAREQAERPVRSAQRG